MSAVCVLQRGVIWHIDKVVKMHCKCLHSDVGVCECSIGPSRPFLQLSIEINQFVS